ncbi:MAG: gamma-glutamylcyclotransferase [candidate division NC10 bacterium]|nr:gamma-glutamylcyclotransferase [candidate division NC10 bacterium]
MLYFAYGSNMDSEQMRERCPESRFITTARLKDFRLVFSRWSEGWDGGVADIEPSKGDVVEGVVYEISATDLASLDSYEGYPLDYFRAYVTLETSAGAELTVIAYFANPMGSFPPSRRYLGQLLKGAWERGLSPEYILFLESIDTVD